MLESLKIGNFKSFKEEAKFDLHATGYEILDETNKTQDNILKGALIVGGNATGKSTVLKAIEFLLKLLVWQVNVDPFDYICLFKEENERMKLEYQFLINQSQIKYIIEGDEQGILSERIYVDEKERLNRIRENAEYTDKNTKRITIENLGTNQSALRKIYFDTKFIDDEVLKKWFEFLGNSVYIDYSQKRINTALADNSITTYKDYFEKQGTDEFNKFLNDIKYEQYVEYAKEYKNEKLNFNFDNNQKDIIVKRKNMEFALPITLESEGTQTLVNTLPMAFDAMRKNAMVIIDEFSSGFHNLLEEAVIKYFMKNSKNAQLFIVSHSTNLLTNTLLRPDQIYTVDFKANKGSILNRVSDSKPREAQNLEKMYLSGVFNGIPRFE